MKKDVTPKDSSIATATQVSKNGLNQFQIQNRMKMAPLIRRDDFDKAGLDSTINSVGGQKSVAHAFGLNCATLKSGRSKPRSQGKTWPYVRKVPFIYYVRTCIAQNLTTSKFFTKTVFFVKSKEFHFQHYILTKFLCCSLKLLVHKEKEKCSKNS